jgi:hypothetical protein
MALGITILISVPLLLLSVIDNGVIGDTPYLALDTLYTLGEGSEKVSGILKAAAAKTDKSLQMCFHNETGYRKTFFNVFESFVQAFLEKEKSLEFFKAVYRITINNLPMGYVLESYTKDQDGDVSIVNNSALMAPVDANSIARNDTVSTSWSSPDGAIINATEYAIENGELTSQFSLKFEEDRWLVEGQLQGKPVNATLDYTGWLLSGFGSYLVLNNLRASENNSGEFHMWTPSADPASALPVVLSKIDDDPNANFKIDLGVLMMKFLADEKGIFRKGTIKQGPVDMKLDLLYSKGEPVLP